jgi:reductive dehalogenase
MGTAGSNHEGLYKWESAGRTMALDSEFDVTDPVATTRKIKSVARFFGASLVGVCKLNRQWLYSHVTNDLTGEHMPLEIPGDYRYAIAIAVEMEFAYIKTSPAGGASAATGLAYSKMAFVAGLLAQFIRGLGHRAIPSGNDTALSIPIAIEAGLGELGRHGLLITEKLGPRVRLCKVFTDLPLVADAPRFFGVIEFCKRCMICAENCPSKAISFGKMTTQAPTISNNPGVLKWPIDPEQCYRFWGANRTDCSNCIRVCPYNQEEGWHHDLVRAVTKRTTLLNPLFIRLHQLVGYDKQASPESIWDDRL